jgi:hypothetical protein
MKNLITKNILFLLLTFSIFHFPFSISALAEVRFVSKTGSSTPPFTTWETAADSIQEAIDICNNGDTVIVANGVYKENLYISTSISLIGSSMDSTVIDGRGMGNYAIIINAGITIENFNIYGKENGLGGVIFINSIHKNIIKNLNINECGHGISCVEASLIAENIIMKNLTSGFSMASSQSVIYNISNCVITVANENATGIGIGYAIYAAAYISNNVILFDHRFRTPTAGIYLGLPSKVYIYNNLISGFKLGNISIDGGDSVFIENNVVLYEQSQGLGSIENSWAPSVIKNVVLANNHIGIWSGIGPDTNHSFNYNNYWNNSLDLDGPSYGDSDIVADPMFVKDINQNIDTIQYSTLDYHLQKYSPAIDKGDPNILDKDGTRSDIGLYGGPFGESYTYQDLAPKAPVNLTAVVDTNKILLTWNKNSEADTSHYNVYRDTVINFTADSTQLISSQTDTFYIQTIPQGINRLVYKITAVDNQGNESNTSEEVVINLTSIKEYPSIVNDYYLYQNYPNPFNPSTKIGYKLKERGYVKLMVYDIKGELVSVLVNKEQQAGYYEVEFNAEARSEKLEVKGIASGIYLYRIEVIGKGNIPVYSDMRKMMLVK